MSNSSLKDGQFLHDHCHSFFKEWKLTNLHVHNSAPSRDSDRNRQSPHNLLSPTKNQEPITLPWSPKFPRTCSWLFLT